MSDECVSAMTHHVVLYTKEGCCLCDRAKTVLRRIQGEFALEIEEVDITRDPELVKRYGYTIPVVVVDGKHTFESKIAEHYLRKVLEPGADLTPGPFPAGEGGDGGRDGETGRRGDGGIGPAPDLPLGPRGRRAVRVVQRGCLWLARHWLAVANGVNLLVLALSAAPPALRAAGMSWLAGPLFDAFRAICHQLPYRSFFLLDYQMAMCQRNVAIYGSMALAGLGFIAVRGRLRPLSWRWYALALLPIAVDGLTQLLEFRESTWELRVLTGSLFGTASVWLAYPYLERFAVEILESGGRLTGRRGDGETRGRREGS